MDSPLTYVEVSEPSSLFLDFPFPLIPQPSPHHSNIIQMSHRGDKRILIAPEELLVDSPDLGKVYIESLRLTNTLAAPVDLVFKLPSHPDRVYEITPQSMRIQPGEEGKVELRFKVTKAIPKAKNVRDVLNIKADYFEQQFVVTYRAGERGTATPTRVQGRRSYEELDRENKDLKSALEEKSADLVHSESRVAQLESDLNSLHRDLESLKDLQEEVHRLKEENEEMQERVEDSEELHSYFDQVKAMLNERMPNFDELIDLSLKQERLKHQRISDKALVMLKAKDAEIEELNVRIEEQQEAIQQLQQKLSDSRVLISNTEQTLKHTQKSVEELKMTIYDKDQIITHLETEMEELRNLANRSETEDFEKHELQVKSSSQLEELKAALQLMEASLSAKSSAFDSLKAALDKSENEVKTLREKEQYVLELSARQSKLQQDHERLARDKDRIIAELTAKVSTQTDHIQSLLSQFSQPRDSEVVTRVLKLEEENRHLQMQLAESRGSSRSMKEEDLRVPSRKVQGLEEENARLSKSIKESQLEFSRVRKEMEESLAGKNRELIDMQQRLLELRNQVAGMQTQGKSQEALAISEENTRLKQSLQELASENEILAKRIDRDSPAGDPVIQTQLISRLNARVTSLKAREERALEALSKAEEALRLKEELMSSERSQWLQERQSILSSTKSPVKGENAVVQTERQAWESPSPFQAETMEQVWTQAMVQRYERRLAELDKDSTGYQMKHYAALKETHDLKEQLSRRISEDIENQTRWERDNVQLQVKCESLKEQIAHMTAEVTGQAEELTETRGKVALLQGELAKIKQEAARSAASRESDVVQLAAQRESLQSELKERTAQVAILMESLVAVQDTESSESVSKKLAELAVQLSSEQAVISNLDLRIAHFKALLLFKDQQIAEISREKSQIFVKSAELEAKNQALTRTCDQMAKQVMTLKQEIAAKSHDNQALQAQMQRFQEDLSDSKGKVAIIATQLTESEKRSSQVLAKERRDFKEALLSARDQPLQVLEVSQPVVLALKQLTVALNSLSNSAPNPDLYLQLVKEMGDLVLNCDKSLIMAEARGRRLEFLTQSEIYFKHLDPGTLETMNVMLNKLEMMGNEVKRLKKPQTTNMQEIYRRRIEELEAVVKERNDTLRVTEGEREEKELFAATLREKLQWLESKVAALQADKAAFEVVVLARAEEELQSKVRLRDESVKTYIDGVITRAALSSSEANKLLTLSREIAALKLANDQLVSEVEGRNKEKDLLFLANEALKATLQDLERPKEALWTAKESPNVELRAKYDIQTKKVFELREEKEDLQGKLVEMEQLLQATKENSTPRETGTVPVSAKEEDLKNQLLELKELHKTELEALRVDCNLKMQQFKKELETQYSQALEQFQDGDFPGDFKRRAETLERQLKDLAGEHGAMEDMLIQAQAANNALNQANSLLKEELDVARAVLSDLQNPIPASLEAPPSPKRGSVSRKTSKKQLSLDRPTEQRAATPLPQKLVKALVAAKIGEAEACKKLRSAGKMQVELRENTIKKDAKIRDLEAKIKTLESRRRTETNTPSLDRDSEPAMTLKSRISALEQEVSELRLAEASNWSSYLPLYSAFHEEDMSMSEVPRDDFAILVEGIVYLTQHLDQEAGPSPPFLEQCQRLVIRALGKTIGRLAKEPLGELIEYRPTRAEDRQVWYLELLETQLNEVHDTIRRLVEFTNKVTVEVTGSFTGSAQYKGASLELAKCIKETAEEVETMRNLCLLVKNDLNGLRPAGTASQATDELAYRDRAILAENMKRRLEEEMVTLKMEHSFALSQLESQVAEANEIKKRSIAQLDVSESERLRLTSLAEEAKARAIQAEIALDRERETAVQLKAQISDMAGVKQDAGRQVDKFQRELKQWQNEHMENLRGKEELIAELQKQVKALEADRQRQETAKKARTQKRGEGEEGDNLDLKRKLGVLTEERKLDEAKIAKEREMYETQLSQREGQLREMRNELQAKEDELDSVRNELKKASKAFKPPRQKEAAKQADLELEVHSQAIEIMNMKNEHEGELIRLQALLADVQRQLREKVEAADLEVRKRLETEARLREMGEERRVVEGRLREISEGSAVEVRSWQEEAAKTEAEMNRLRSERDKISRLLQAKTTEADTLAQVILQTEKDHKNTQSELRLEKDKLSEALSFEKAQQVALSSELKHLSSSFQALQAELRSSQSREDDLKDIISAKEQAISDLRKEIMASGEKQRTWEATFETLKEGKETSEAALNEEIRLLKGEMGRQFEAYTKNLEMSEGQLTALKELVAEEQRAKRGVKKGAEVVDYFVQLAKKDAVINALKADLRASKKKTTAKACEEEQPQVYRLKTKIHALKAQLAQEKDSAARLQDQLDRYESSQQDTKEKDLQNRKDLVDIERKYKGETQRLAEEVNRIREKWHSPEEWANSIAAQKDLEAAHRRVVEELRRKSELLDSLKSAKEQHDSEANALQDELENIKDIAEQVKKLKAEVLRKDRALQEMKTALDQMRESDKRLGEENAVLAERWKTAAADVKRKETIVRELRGKLENLSGDVESGKAASDQVEKLREQVKRLKQDLERKDSAAKLLKTKLETAEQEANSLNSRIHQASTDAFTALEAELNKNKVLDANLKRSEAQLQALYLITKRIFRELVKSVETLKLRVTETEGFDREMYSDCMDILRLSEDELKEFVGQGRDSTSGVMEQIDRLLEEKAVNVNEVIDLFERLLEERAQLERSSGEVAGKYQDYIRRMQQEVTQEREAYEQKIKDLEASIKRKRKA